MRTGQRAGTGPRVRCATRERRMRGRPAPGRAPPRPVGLNSRLVWRGCRRRRACRVCRFLLVWRRRFPCTRRHLCGPAVGKEPTRNYCIYQQYFCNAATTTLGFPINRTSPFSAGSIGPSGVQRLGCAVARRAIPAPAPFEKDDVQVRSPMLGDPFELGDVRHPCETDAPLPSDCAHIHWQLKLHSSEGHRCSIDGLGTSARGTAPAGLSTPCPWRRSPSIQRRCGQGVGNPTSTQRVARHQVAREPVQATREPVGQLEQGYF